MATFFFLFNFIPFPFPPDFQKHCMKLAHVLVQGNSLDLFFVFKSVCVCVCVEGVLKCDHSTTQPARNAVCHYCGVTEVLRTHPPILPPQLPLSTGASVACHSER